MKKLMLVTVSLGVSLLASAQVWAADEVVNAEDAGLGNIHVRCKGSSAHDPFLDVHGSVSITEGQPPYYRAIGILTFIVGGGSPPQNFNVVGQYFKSGKLEYLSLLPPNPAHSQLVEIYVNLKDQSGLGESYFATTESTFRMSCEGSGSED